MKKLLQFMLNFQLKNSQLSKSGGFTLIELLVALAIASVIISSLLGFMVNILTTERREQAKTESEQEIQAAINYIARDLRQAVYIYDGQGLANVHSADPATSGIRNQIPPLAPSNGCTDPAICQPVLVFWKREFVADALPINSSADCDPDGTVDVNLCDDTFAYSLVGYYLIKDTDATWSGTARIARFQINNGVPDPTTADPDDYVAGHSPDPGFAIFNQNTSDGTLRERMNQWTKSVTAYNQPVSVLVDYIDQSNVGVPAPSSETGLETVDCPAILGTDGYDLDGVSSTIEYNVQQAPDYTATGFPAALKTGSFYACVDSLATEAKIFIRGNAYARINSNNVDAATYDESRAEFFPTTNLRVEGRGLVN